MTNAHVVAGQDDTTVQLGGTGPSLRGAGGRLRPPRRHRGPARRRASAAARCRSPPSRARARRRRSSASRTTARTTSAPARLGATRAVLTQDAYGRGPVRRSIVTAARARAPRQLGRPAGRRARARGGHGLRRDAAAAPARRLRRARTRSSQRDLGPGTGGARCPPGPAPAELPCGVHGQDPRHRREAVRRAGPRARAAGPVREAHRRGERPRAGWRAPSTSSPGPSATSSSSPSPTSTTTSSRSGAWPTCRSCPTRFKLVVRDERSQKQMTVVATSCAATTSTSSSTPATPGARAS